MATAVTTLGKYNLFKYGWESTINYARLYTATDTLVDTKTIAMNYASNVLSPTADIVFNVPAGTNDVSYVVIGNLTTGTYTSFYSKDLSALYDFTTAGTLTIDSWEISLSGTYLQTTGRQALFETGWESYITWAKAYTLGDVIVDTQSTTFTANISTGAFSPTADIVFNVSAGTNDVAYINLGYTSGTDIVFYKRIFSTYYDFVTAGTLTVDSWTISVS